MHKLAYTDEAVKQISKLDERTKKDIRTAVEAIANDPSLGKPLTRELKGRFSCRVGDYRIIYRIYRAEILVLILAVGHRRDIYEKMSRKNW